MERVTFDNWRIPFDKLRSRTPLGDYKFARLSGPKGARLGNAKLFAVGGELKRKRGNASRASKRVCKYSRCSGVQVPRERQGEVGKSSPRRGYLHARAAMRMRIYDNPFAFSPYSPGGSFPKTCHYPRRHSANFLSARAMSRCKSRPNRSTRVMRRRSNGIGTHRANVTYIADNAVHNFVRVQEHLAFPPPLGKPPRKGFLFRHNSLAIRPKPDGSDHSSWPDGVKELKMRVAINSLARP